MSTSLIREKPVKPAASRPAATGPRPVILTRAETCACTCPEPCERDHEHD